MPGIHPWGGQGPTWTVQPLQRERERERETTEKSRLVVAGLFYFM